MKENKYTLDFLGADGRPEARQEVFGAPESVHAFAINRYKAQGHSGIEVRHRGVLTFAHMSLDYKGQPLVQDASLRLGVLDFLGQALLVFTVIYFGYHLIKVI